MKLPKISLGANPFHGVSYVSSAARQEYGQRFPDPENIASLMRYCVEELGVRGIHCFASAPMVQAVATIRQEYRNDVAILAVVPDIYTAMARETRTSLREAGREQIKRLVMKLPAVIRASTTGNILPMFEKAIMGELADLAPTAPTVVMLHGMLTDGACVTKQRELLACFADLVESRNAVPGLATHNLPLAARSLREMGLAFAIIMAPVNSKGFMMNPSVSECLETIVGLPEGTSLLAKKILAGGTIAPHEGASYVFEQAGVSAAVVAVADEAEAQATFGACKSVLGASYSEMVDVACKGT